MNRFLNYLCLSIVLLMAGCAHYIKGDFNSIESTSEPLAIYIDRVSGRDDASFSHWVRERNDSRLKAVCEADDTTRLNITFYVNNSANNSISGYLSLLTLGILPTYWFSTGVANVEVIHKKQIIKEFRYVANIHTWYGWLPTLIAEHSTSPNVIRGCNEGCPDCCLDHAVRVRLLDRLNVDLKSTWPNGLCTSPRLS